MYLSPRQVQTANVVHRALAGAWEDDEPLSAAEKALRGLLPARLSAIYTVDGEGVLASLYANLPQAEGAARELLSAGLHRYCLRGRDRFANHAVDDAVLFADDAPGYAEFVDHLHGHELDVDHALRVVVQHDDHTCGWIGFMRGKSDGKFTGDDRAMLQHLVPQLEAIVTAAHVLDAGRLRGLDLQAMLDTFDEPALVCSEAGQIVLVNDRARRRYPKTPEWLGHSVRVGTDATAKVTPVRIDERKLLLVVPRPIRDRSQDIRSAPDANELPPYLAGLVELMMEGLSDRQIADRTGRSYNTVRTYVRRLYARYGVSNRMQLLRALGR